MQREFRLHLGALIDGRKREREEKRISAPPVRRIRATIINRIVRRREEGGCDVKAHQERQSKAATAAASYPSRSVEKNRQSRNVGVSFFLVVVIAKEQAEDERKRLPPGKRRQRSKKRTADDGGN